MGNLFFVVIAFACLVLELAGCAINPADVKVVQPLNATEAKQYNEVGPLYCTADQLSPGQNSDQLLEWCRTNLRQQAGGKRADTLVIESQNKVPCVQPAGQNECIHLVGRAYARIPDTPPVPMPGDNTSGFPSASSRSSFPSTAGSGSGGYPNSSYPNTASSSTNSTYPSSTGTGNTSAGAAYPNTTHAGNTNPYPTTGTNYPSH